MTEYSFTSPDAASTAAWGAKLARLLKTGDIVLLYGDLGMGKTTFARGLIQSLSGAEDVVSPTFTLVQMYPVDNTTIYHYDLYRLKEHDDSALEELGWDDGLANGITLVEWPERLTKIPAHALSIHITQEDDGRLITFDGGAAWQTRLKSL